MTKKKCVFCGSEMKKLDTQYPNWDNPLNASFKKRTRYYCVKCGWEARFYKDVI